jgi:DNA-binding FadR family transcriptional regulator
MSQDPSRSRGTRNTGVPVYRNVVRESSLSDKVAALLTESILAGVVRPGQRLPSERELMEQFGVSRSVIREAVRSVAAKGLVKQQPRAGHVVSELGPDSVTESMTMYLRGRGPYGLEKLMEVRATIETQTAELAAERASTKEVDEIRTADAELRGARGARQAALADIAFHRADRVTREAVRAEHATILERIADRDSAGARLAMQAHIEDSARRLGPLHARSLDA